MTSQLLQLGSKLRSLSLFYWPTQWIQTRCFILELKLFFKVRKTIYFFLKILLIIVLINILELRVFFVSPYVWFSKQEVVILGSSQSLHRECVVRSFCHWNFPLKKIQYHKSFQFSYYNSGFHFFLIFICKVFLLFFSWPCPCFSLYSDTMLSVLWTSLCSLLVYRCSLHILSFLAYSFFREICCSSSGLCFSNFLLDYCLLILMNLFLFSFSAKVKRICSLLFSLLVIIYHRL